METVSTETKKDFKIQKRKRILFAALELFATQGYDGTSVSQIARAAGISKGLTYVYFDSKEDLLFQIINFFKAEDEVRLTSLYDDDPNVFLKRLIHDFFSRLRQRPEHVKLITSLMLQVSKYKFIQEMAIDKYLTYFQLMQELLDKIGFPDSRREAKLLTGMLDGIAIQYNVVGEDYPLTETEQYILTKYVS
ncbi:TetR/AcrR family transcriptional regulator [Marinigracilibium pacificum]|uniref:TetR/AcrR family transcriptional regulator n=1 Tax=Marinigracilibium pacificum TaxID=2729599 RepID=A0A848IUS1_9BACT|nr:TetR/AcrR family transcriptional regulator [Marinigracilibium pacificum]NMM46971.1 TetR/AcrR family transcriptional regulator [Marinigracilibium pacificum]